MKTFLSFIILWSTTSVAVAQSKNKEITINENQRILVGKIDREGLNLPSYNNWFTKNYENYDLDESIISKFEQKLSGYNIKVFMGTWCGDSKREVPRFLKILEQAKFPNDKLQIIAVDVRKEHYKKSPTGEEWGLQILRVPTIIFYKNGREVNRIIESPNKSLEEDILDIVLGKPYKPRMARSMHFD